MILLYHVLPTILMLALVLNFSEHPPVGGQKISSKCLGGIIGIPQSGEKKVKTFRWDHRLQGQDVLLYFILVGVSHIQRNACRPERTTSTLQSGQSRSWSAEQGKEKRTKRESLASHPSPAPPVAARTEGGKKSSLACTVLLYCSYRLLDNFHRQVTINMQFHRSPR